MLKYPGLPDEALYTNQIIPYYRAPHILMGFPTRYVDRGSRQSLEHWPDGSCLFRCCPRTCAGFAFFVHPGAQESDIIWCIESLVRCLCKVTSSHDFDRKVQLRNPL